MRKWTIIAAITALALLGMGATPRFLEELRIGGGYHETVDGGIDLDNEGNIAADGTITADGGFEAGVEGTTRGVATLWDGDGTNAPGCLRMGSTNGSEAYLFLENDLAGLRVSATLPTANTDGALFAAGKLRGAGSITDAVDLATAEVAGTLPATSVSNGLTDTQVNDNLTINGGTVNNTPIGAATPSTGRFTTLQTTGDLLVDGGDIGTTSDADLLGLATDKLTVRGGLASSTGALESGVDATTRGMITAFHAANAPGCLKLVSTNGTTAYLFATNDGAGLRIASCLPTSDTDGAWLASGKFRGSGSTTDAVDLATAEVAGTLPASSVGTGLTDTQVNDNLTVSAGTINNTPIGATTPSTAVFSKLTLQGAFISDIVTLTANDTTPSVANAHVCMVPNAWDSNHNITDFDNAVAGQMLTIIGNDPDCILVDAGHLRLAGNWVADEYCTMTLIFDGLDWLEISRTDTN